MYVEVGRYLSELARDGATVLVSSHLLAEVEQICSHVGVMYEGRLVAQGPLSELRAGTVQTVRVDTDRTEDAARVLGYPYIVGDKVALGPLVRELVATKGWLGG